MSRPLVALAGVLLVACAALAAAPSPPYDFTGRWTGTIAAGLETLPVDVELATVGTRTFAGSGMVNRTPCTVRGKRKRTVVLRIRCEDRTKGRLVGLLDLASGSVAGAGGVRRSGRRVAATFTIAKAVPPACGNGVLESGEQCDDGNTAGGDGCSASCTIEVTPPILEVEPNNFPNQATVVPAVPAFVQGAIATSGDLDFYRIVITGSDLLLETFDGDGPGSCSAGTDTVLELRSADGVTIVAIDDDGGIGPCSRLDLHGLTPGVYFPCVRAPTFGVTIPVYQLSIAGR